MLRLRTILIVFVVTGLALFATNPGPADMREQLTEILSKELEVKTRDMGPDAAALARMALPLLVSQITIDHRNYGVLSVFKLSTSLGDGPRPPIAECYLGVARRFVELRRC